MHSSATSKRTQSPRSIRRSPRCIELTPLSCTPTPLPTNDINSSSQSESNVREESPQLLPTRTPTSVKVPKKAYPRLLTIPQLAETHVDAMHSGAFLSRSVDRWREFERSVDNQQHDNVAADHWRQSDDAERAYKVARESGAIVIQSAYRRFVAVSMHKRLVVALWQRQLRIAAWVASHYECFHSRLQQLNTNDTLLPTADASPLLSLRGACVHLPATLLTLWLCFTCARTSSNSSRALRRSPAIVQTVDLPVRRVLRIVASVWRTTIALATRHIQCAARSFLARRRFRQLHGEFVRHRSLLQLQCFFRVCLARRLVLRLRRRCAALRIQCAWRCATARTRVQRQRICCVAQRFWVAASANAVAGAVRAIHERAATIVQRIVRGQRARGRVRRLRSVQEQTRWRQNPSKGYALVAAQQFHHAALCLEHCRLQGYVRNLKLAPVIVVETSCQVQTQTQQQLRPDTSSSTMSYSFSIAPTPLEPLEWLHAHTKKTSACGYPDIQDSDTLACLHFWFAYALSHWQVYDATGCVDNLERSQMGWHEWLHECATFVSDAVVERSTVLTHARREAQLHLLQCLFYSSNSTGTVSNDAKHHALALSQLLLDELDTSSNDRDTRAQVLMTRSMLQLQLQDTIECCATLETLLTLLPLAQYSELEVRFVLVLIQSRSSQQQTALHARRSKPATTTTQHLTRCFQLVERWRGVGCFHGTLTSNDAKQRLAAHTVGSYLLYSDLDVVEPATQATTKTVPAAADLNDVLLKVKLSDVPLRITTLRIHAVRAANNSYSYSSPKLSQQQQHASLDAFVAHLPVAAGICLDLGIRTALFATPALDAAAATDDERRVRRRLLQWPEWQRHVRALRRSAQTRSVRSSQVRWNESWAALCFVVARVLEGSNAFVFAALAAKAALESSRNRFVVASASFVAAKSACHLHQRDASKWFLRLAELSSAPTTEGGRSIEAGHATVPTQWRRNFCAVQHGLFYTANNSSVEPFIAQLERVQKLERMCLRAWRFSSLAVTMRGDATSEALLLQRIYDEMYATCGDTFFLRSLVRAHLSAFVSGRSRFETAHVRLAVDVGAQLVQRFCQQQHGTTGQSNTSRIDALDTLVQIATASRSYTVATKATIATSPTPVRTSATFPIHHMLLIWHHMPLSVCYELAESLYRAATLDVAGVNTRRVIDVYESIYGRLRGATSASTTTYAVMEDVVLLRLAFLYVQRASESATGVRYLCVAVTLLDELLALRVARKQYTACSVTPIVWPCSLTLASRLSTAEVAFTRGLLLEMLEVRKAMPRAQRTSWQSYNALHTELVAAVARASAEEAAQRAQQPTQLCGVRVFIGATQYVAIADVLRSKPSVTIQCEGTTAATQTPPSWTSMAPQWHEFVELDGATFKSRLVVTLVDRSRRFGGGETSIGSVQVYASDILQTPDAFKRGRFYDLMPPSSVCNASRYEPHDNKLPSPQLFLSFEAIYKRHDGDVEGQTKRFAKRKCLCGHWDLSDLRAHLHGDLETFVTSPWVWRAIARRWFNEHEFAIARWFYVRAVDAAATSSSLTTSLAPALIAHVGDLQALSTCYRATMSQATWISYATPLLERADALLQTGVANGTLNSVDAGVQRLLQNVATDKQVLQIAADTSNGSSASNSDLLAPFATELERRTPASSEWVKIPVRASPLSFLSPDALSSAGCNACYFVNLDTGEYFVPQSTDCEKNALAMVTQQPLEYEDTTLLKRCNYEALGQQRPHRIVIMSIEMRARVQLHCLDIAQRQAHDTQHAWTAVFNTRRQRMQFFSVTRAAKPCGADENRDSSRCRNRRDSALQPRLYVMAADAFMLYHVLIVQDAYRHHRRRQQCRRKLCGVIQCVRWLTHELLAARARIVDRAEQQRKRSLNCLHVVIERAHHLRAGDVLTSDPFVIVTVRDRNGVDVAIGRTSVRHNTRQPKWHEEFAFPLAWMEFARCRHRKTGANDDEDKDATTTNDNDSDSDEGTDDAGADKDRRLQRFGSLCFEVFDYDFVALRSAQRKTRSKYDSSDSADSCSDNDNDDDDDVSATRKMKRDVLGVATLAIASLENGLPLETDLRLQRSTSDEDIATTHKTNGSLSVVVHWKHSLTFASDADKAAAALVDRSAARESRRRRVIDAIKHPLAKQPLTEDHAQALSVVRAHLATTHETLLELAKSTLEPLLRLYKRLRDAQVHGRTADEANVVAQRMRAIVATQLVAKLQHLDSAVRTANSAAQHFACDDALLTLAREFIDTQVSSVCQELNAMLQSVCERVQATASELAALVLVEQPHVAASPSLTPPTAINSSVTDLTKLECSFAAVFCCHQLLCAWHETLETLTTTFFAYDTAQWTRTAMGIQVDEVVGKLEALSLNIFASCSVGGAVAKTLVETGRSRPAASTSQTLATQPALAHSTDALQAAPPKAATNRRLERIQREKQRKTQQHK